MSDLREQREQRHKLSPYKGDVKRDLYMGEKQPVIPVTPVKGERNG